ncbi:MAG TPA: ABC transporter ATP-binding protein [Ktedonobacteraceae bacterium]|jgi:ABC-2 type transport system ATP-binding protein
MSTIVEADGLIKRFGKLTAIDTISFSLEAGKIYGLLGRNGSGKTTLLRLLTAQLFATGGKLLVFGEQPYENRRVLSQICFMKENQKYPKSWRVSDVLAMAPLFFPRWDVNYARALSEDFHLPLAQKVSALSRGALSAMGIVVGLASHAPLSIFDEPLGLDVVARSLFYEHLLADYVEHPRTILISTHLVDEVSRLLEHVLVLDQGQLILDEEAEALRSRAFTVTGSEQAVATFTEGRMQIGGEHFGSLVSAMLLGNADDAGARREAAALGLEVTPVSLQRLIIHLTSTTSHRKAREVV